MAAELNINDLNLNTLGEISAFNYNNYTYKNLSLNGVFPKKTI